MFQTVVEKIKTHFVFQKPCRLSDNVEKYCRAGQATSGNMAYAHCMLWIPKATNAHSEYVRLTFPLQQWLTNAPRCYAVRTLPVLLVLLYLFTSP